MGIFRQFPYSNFHDMNMDEIIKIVRQLADDWVAYQQKWSKLYDDTAQALEDFKAWAYSYFDNLDVQDEINNKLEDMLDKGAFDPIIRTQLAPVVTDWLEENITTPESVVIDSSLSIAGAAADAKAAGDAIKAVADDVSLSNDTFTYASHEISGGRFHLFSNGYYRLAAEGSQVNPNQINADPTLMCTKIICSEGTQIHLNGNGDAGIKRLYAFVDSNNTVLYLSPQNLSGKRTITAPANTSYVLINILKASNTPYAYTGDLISDINVFELTDLTQGGLTPTGEGSSSVYCRTGYIDIDDFKHVYKPAGELSCSIYLYDSNKNYIDRITSYVASSEIDLDRDQIKRAWTRGNTRYVRIAAKRNVNDVEVTSTPEEIIAAGLKIEIYGVSDAVYDQIIELKREAAVDQYRSLDLVQGALNSAGEEGNSLVYCRTDFIDIKSIEQIIKPAGQLGMIVCQYDADKNFVDRVTNATNAVSIEYDHAKAETRYGMNGTVKYLRFSIKRNVDGTEVNSTPADILNAGMVLKIAGVSDPIYQRLVELEKNMSGDSAIPAYYETHLKNKIDTINEISDYEMTNQNDNFIFLTDYHWQSNSQNSVALIKKVVADTGITKMFFGGDAGKTSAVNDKYEAARLNAAIYNKFWDAVPNFYGLIGNHEWNDRQDETHEAARQDDVYSRVGVFNFYLRREQKLANEMSSEGNYIVDNEGSRIRYIVLQCTGQARITNTTCQWLIAKLNQVPAGYYVVVLSHAVFDGWAHATDHEAYYGDRCRMSVKRITDILGAYKTRASGTVDQLADYYNAAGSDPFVTGTIPYDFTNANGTPVCVIGGHNHKDASRTENGILIIQTTTDGYNANEDPDVVRTPGTATEQAFDVFTIDTTEKTISTVRIGYGSDRTFTYGV